MNEIYPVGEGSYGWLFCFLWSGIQRANSTKGSHDFLRRSSYLLLSLILVLLFMTFKISGISYMYFHYVSSFSCPNHEMRQRENMY